MINWGYYSSSQPILTTYGCILLFNPLDEAKFYEYSEEEKNEASSLIRRGNIVISTFLHKLLLTAVCSRNRFFFFKVYFDRQSPFNISSHKKEIGVFLSFLPSGSWENMQPLSFTYLPKLLIQTFFIMLINDHTEKQRYFVVIKTE